METTTTQAVQYIVQYEHKDPHTDRFSWVPFYWTYDMADAAEKARKHVQSNTQRARIAYWAEDGLLIVAETMKPGHTNEQLRAYGEILDAAQTIQRVRTQALADLHRLELPQAVTDKLVEAMNAAHEATRLMEQGVFFQEKHA